MRHTISLFIVLAAFWWLNSGYDSALMLSLAGGSIAFVLYIAHRMDVVDHECQPLHLSAKIFGYYDQCEPENRYWEGHLRQLYYANPGHRLGVPGGRKDIGARLITTKHP